MLFTETRTFKFSHNLLLGFVPDVVTEEVLEKVFKENPQEVGNFGLFGSDIDFNSYYPEVTLEDLQPKESDFVEPLFRALSETVLNKHWDPISFEKPGVLKSSMKLLIGQSVYPNHENSVGNELGVVSKVFWQDSYVSKDGITIPAGFNAKLKIDGKSNPKIARGVMMDPPSVHSASVTVTFSWEKSHPELSDSDFRNLRGTMGADGKMIMKVANKIIAYHEISFVPHGADPFAQKVKDDGEIVNPKHAKSRSSFSGHIFDFKTDDGKFEIETIHNSQNNSQNENDMEFSEFVSQLNLGENQFTDMAALQAHIKQLMGTSESYQAVVAKTSDKPIEFIDGLIANQKTEEEIGILSFVEAEGGVEGLTATKNLSQEPLNTLRAEAVRFYKLVYKENPQDAIINTINNADATAAKSFLDTYRKEFDERIPLSCKDCGSHNIDRSSFLDTGADPEPPKVKSIEEVRKSFKADSGVKASTLHGS